MFQKEPVEISLVQWFLAKNSINVLVDEDVLAYEKAIREKDTARRFEEFRRRNPIRGFFFTHWEEIILGSVLVIISGAMLEAFSITFPFLDALPFRIFFFGFAVLFFGFFSRFWKETSMRKWRSPDWKEELFEGSEFEEESPGSFARNVCECCEKGRVTVRFHPASPIRFLWVIDSNTEEEYCVDYWEKPQ